MTQIPEKLDAHSPHYQMINTINQLIDYLHELTSRIDTIAGNQLEMKRGKRCPKEDFGFEPKDQPKRWRAEEGKIYWCIDSVGTIWHESDNFTPGDNYRYAIGNYHPTREAAEAYKAKLLSDNAQV